MILYLFIAGTVVMAFDRGRRHERFWSSFAIEAGFLVALLHDGFLSGAWSTSLKYPSFVLGWVVPAIVGCLIADEIGRLVGRWQEQKPRG